MKQHVFNLYPVTNQNELRFSYRHVEVDGELGAASDDPDLAAKNLNLLARKVAFGQELPVAIIRGGEKPLLAVAADRPIKRCEYQLTPHVASLRPQEEIHSVDFCNLDEATRQIALSFLGWELRGHLYGHRDLWRSGPNTFFRKKAVNNDDARRQFDIYGGFSPRFLFIEGLLHIAVPVIYCYTDAQWADKAFDERTIQRLGGRRMLYHFGPQIYPVKFQKRTGKSLRAQQFSAEGSNKISNVFDWTVERAGEAPAGRRLDPDSMAIQYRNVGNEEERYGALSLCKLMLNNDDSRVARSRREHQRTPRQRIERATGIVSNFLTGVRLSGVNLKFSSALRSATAKHFGYPEIRFGNGRVLRVSKTPNNGSVLLKDLARTRAAMLEDKNVGFAVLSELDDQVLIAPRSLRVDVVNDLKSRIEGLVSSLIRKPYTLQLVRYNDENKRTLRDQVKAVVSSLKEFEVEGGRGVLVLPPRSQPDLHNYIKKNLRNHVQFQCMSAEKLSSFYPSNGGGNNQGNSNGQNYHNGRDGQKQIVRPFPENKFRSYLLNMVMGLMIVNRQWPWVLNKPTHYDAYIGLDVLDHTAAFTFFYEGGAVCAMRDQESSHKEKLSRELVAKLVYDGLKQDLPDLDEPPRSIVLRRDGRLFDSEWLGFLDAIKKLKAEGLLQADILTGAVEVPKHYSYGVRLAESGSNGLQNPELGAWERLTATEGIVCTTGLPFNIPGTVEPLVVRVVRADLNLEWVLEDTFGMSQLCWPVPTACMRLPIDLKLCDEHLRAFAGRADEDNALFGGTLENDEELLLAAAR
ncbi:MAG TPA: hypothetical protein VMF08_09225 [Candidatus Sulfotelmatobacter sp.]|nr:hypothetical protein [Candidatus Sulfotelmatobacter sp.]